MDAPSGRYEFSAAENEVLASVVRWSALLAWFLMIGAGVVAVGAALSGEAASIGSLIVAAIYFLIGLNFRGAARSMASVVETSGNDIEHLMAALGRLASAFRITAITLLVGSVLFVVAVVSIWRWMGSGQAPPF